VVGVTAREETQREREKTSISDEVIWRDIAMDIFNVAYFVSSEVSQSSLHIHQIITPGSNLLIDTGLL